MHTNIILAILLAVLAISQATMYYRDPTPPTPIEGVENGKIVLKCTLAKNKCENIGTIKWKRYVNSDDRKGVLSFYYNALTSEYDGELIDRASHRETLLGSELEIHSLEMSDAGEYSCHITYLEQRCEFMEQMELKVSTAPICKFELGVTDVGVQQLTCRVINSSEEANFEWKLNGKPFDDNITINSSMSSIILNDSSDYVGTFACIANNTIGKSSPCEYNYPPIAINSVSSGVDDELGYSYFNREIFPRIAQVTSALMSWLRVI